MSDRTADDLWNELVNKMDALSDGALFGMRTCCESEERRRQLSRYRQDIIKVLTNASKKLSDPTSNVELALSEMSVEFAHVRDRWGQKK